MFCKRYRHQLRESSGSVGSHLVRQQENADQVSRFVDEFCQKQHMAGDHPNAALLEECNINETNQLGQTALHLTSKHGLSNFVDELLKHGAKTDLFDNEEMTAMMYASQYGHTAVVRCLVKNGACVNLSNSKGRLALHYSCLQGHSKCTKLLLEYKSKPNYPDNEGTTPLILACQSNDVHVVQLLLDAGARPDKLDKLNRSALHWAALSDNKDAVDALIRAGASLDLLDKYFATPFMYSILNNSSSALKSLVSSGCDTIALDGMSGTALTLTALKGHNACVKVLLSAGENPDEFSYFGMTPLMASVYESHYEVTETILQYKPNINIVSRLGFTALFASLCHITESNALTRHKLLVLLLQHGADINQCFGSTTAFSNIMNGKNSPVLFAITTGYLSLVKILLYAGSIVTHDELDYLIIQDSAINGCKLSCVLSAVISYKSSPLSLQHLCRLMIRKCIGDDPCMKVQELPVPGRIKEYLNFSDLADILPEHTKVRCTFHGLVLTMLDLKTCGLQSIQGSYLFEQVNESVLRTQQPGPCLCNTCMRIRNLQQL